MEDEDNCYTLSQCVILGCADCSEITWSKHNNIIHNYTLTKSLQTDNKLMYKEKTKHGREGPKDAPSCLQSLRSACMLHKANDDAPSRLKTLLESAYEHKDQDDALTVWCSHVPKAMKTEARKPKKPVKKWQPDKTCRPTSLIPAKRRHHQPTKTESFHKPSDRREEDILGYHTQTNKKLCHILRKEKCRSRWCGINYLKYLFLFPKELK